MKVTIATDRLNKRYSVRLVDASDDLLHHNTDYIWGDFDCGRIYPQRARADAWAYAEQLSKRLGCRWHVV